MGSFRYLQPRVTSCKQTVIFLCINSYKFITYSLLRWLVMRTTIDNTSRNDKLLSYIRTLHYPSSTWIISTWTAFGNYRDSPKGCGVSIAMAIATFLYHLCKKLTSTKGIPIERYWFLALGAQGTSTGLPRPIICGTQIFAGNELWHCTWVLSLLLPQTLYHQPSIDIKLWHLLCLQAEAMSPATINRTIGNRRILRAPAP